MRNKYSYKDISGWFLSKESMTPKKLQKLTYYAEAWAYALLDDGILKDTAFQAWIHGPVSPELWKDYRDYGWNEIEKKAFDESKLDKNVLELFDAVWTTYGDKSGYELEAVSHSEEPWKNARKGLGEFEASNRLISPDDMRNYYKSIYSGD
ncbi:Panacea domain-containing protein [Mycoplasmopsis agalactiae]|uniref:Panacea domain-containing protein n=1 Tax=Mycoplasmopsis agalactiae TaxID=2110 RepID=UPI002F42781C